MRGVRLETVLGVVIGEEPVQCVGVVTIFNELFSNFTQYLLELTIRNGLFYPVLWIALGRQSLLERVTKLHRNGETDQAGS